MRKEQRLEAIFACRWEGFRSGKKLTRSNLKGVSQETFKRPIWPFLRQVSLRKVIRLRGAKLLAKRPFFTFKKGLFFKTACKAFKMDQVIFPLLRESDFLRPSGNPMSFREFPRNFSPPQKFPGLPQRLKPLPGKLDTLQGWKKHINFFNISGTKKRGFLEGGFANKMYASLGTGLYRKGDQNVTLLTLKVTQK